MTLLKELRKTIDKRKGKKEQIEADIVSLSKSIKKQNKHIINLEKAQNIVLIAGKETQKQIQFHISDIVSLALEGVFRDPYKLVLDFVERRSKTECDIFFERNGERMKPLDSSGFGAANVASFALRVAAWCMQSPRSRNTIILDEPFKDLSEDNQEAASLMVKELSRRLNLQFIIVTHKQALATSADRVFRTTIKNGITKVKIL